MIYSRKGATSGWKKLSKLVVDQSFKRLKMQDLETKKLSNIKRKKEEALNFLNEKSDREKPVVKRELSIWDIHLGSSLGFFCMLCA